MTAGKVISSIGTKWRLLIWLKILLGWLMIVGLSYLTFANHLSIPFQILLVVTSAVISFLLYRDQIPSEVEVESLINSQIPELEYSVSLVNHKPESNLALLQQQRVVDQLLMKSTNISYPVQWIQLANLLLISALIALPAGWLAGKEQSASPSPTKSIQHSKKIIAGEIEPITYELKISVTPPSYSGLKVKYQSLPNLSGVLERSSLSWTLNFNQLPKVAWLKFSDGDSLNLKAKGKTFTGSYKALKKGFYIINFLDQSDQLNSSEFYKLDVIPDNPPEVEITGIPQYQSIYPGEANSTSFKANATDEYGLSDAYLIATITKGSGESVKFREEKIPFSKTISGSRFSENITFTLEQFDMEPGNELYFYLEAWDNQQPPKASRTETYFFILQDTAELAFSLEGDLGIDLMPEYFRSQRQIIIDSEKLLKEKSSISKQEFNQRSNELGFDQKALRLKYGQFIGEEADSGLDIENEVEPEPDLSNPGQVDVLGDFGHDTDHENEEGQLMDKGTEQHHDPVEELSHSHDDTDQATFLEESMKSKLRAALNEMWDAELYLRLFQPEESLPYQYKALKLIKEIKNHARIYVHRMGFDAPPINESKSRLSGELEEVAGDTYLSTYQYEEQLTQTKKLIQSISDLLKRDLPIQNNIQNHLQLSGNELATLAIEDPAKYLGLLSEIRGISEQNQLSGKELLSLKSHLISILPAPDQKPMLDVQPSHELLQQFVEEFTKSNP